jgi:hypothetical protein
MILGVFAFAGGFDPGASSGEYTLGGFWQTWALSAVLFAAAPISYGPTIGDYTRRISARQFSNRHICSALGIGMFVGVLLPSLFGAFTALSFAEFANPTDSYLDDLVSASPGWYVLPIVVISLLGGLSQGVLCVYASGLRVEPRILGRQTAWLRHRWGMAGRRRSQRRELERPISDQHDPVAHTRGDQPRARHLMRLSALLADRSVVADPLPHGCAVGSRFRC